MDTSRIDLLFYTEQISDDRACLTHDEMHHVINVLRRKAGDELSFTDGQGMIYTGRLTQIKKKEAWLEVTSSSPQKPPSFQLTIAVAPTKNFDRMEWCVEKLTEIGVQTIIPMLCERSERKKWNQDRIRKVAISAMKQSKRAYLPLCTEPMKFSAIVGNASSSGTRYIALQSEQSITALKHYKPGSDVLILIGPEGDFADKEIAMAKDTGFVPLSLGDYRLRTETAAIVAATIINALNHT